jgi:hypothetical protein
MGLSRQSISLIVLATFYILQVIFFRDNINDGYLVSDGYIAIYLFSIDMILLVLSLLLILVYWSFPTIFTRCIVFGHSLLYGFTIAWLVLAGPFVDEIGVYFVCNFIIGCSLIMNDLHMYGSDILYPKAKQILDICAAWRREQRSSLDNVDTRNFNGKFQALGDTEDDSLEIGNGSIQIKNRNISDAMHGDVTYSHAQTISAGNAASIDSNDETTTVNFLSADPKVISSLKYVSKDLTDQILTYEGFRLQIDSLSCPTYVKRKGVDRGNSNTITSSDESNQYISELPSNLEWNEFSQVEHCIDSSSCHIYTALWGTVPVILKLIKAERVTSAVAMAEFSIEENILRRVNHDHIVRFYGSGTKPRRFLVLERLAGGSLSHVLGVRSDQAAFTVSSTVLPWY